MAHVESHSQAASSSGGFGYLGDDGRGGVPASQDFSLTARTPSTGGDEASCDGGGGGEALSDDSDDAIYSDPAKLPPHACAYCGVHDPAHVVRCAAHGCNRWFCNGRGTTSGSHIVHHLVRARHKEITLHPDSPIGDTAIECYVCGSRNVFLIGVMPSRSERAVVLLCREPCLHTNALKGLDWNACAWEPLISERVLLAWLVRPPSEREARRARHVTLSEIARIEERWRVDPTAQGFEFDAAPEEVAPLPILFDNGAAYSAAFLPLVKCEAEADRCAKEAVVLRDIPLRWGLSLDKHVTATFTYPARADGDRGERLAMGDELHLRLPVPGGVAGENIWEGTAACIKCAAGDASGNAEVEVELRPDSAKPPTDRTTGFTVEVIWKPTSFDRMQRALRAFEGDERSVTSHLYYRLLGHSVDPISLRSELPAKLGAPGLPPLNASQEAAVRDVLTRPLALIQGPPGTGKTVTSATIVHHLVQLAGPGTQVLVAAPSNVAVDHLAAKLHTAGLKVVRVCAKTREAVDSPLAFLSLHVLVRKYAEEAGGELAKLLRLRDEAGGALCARDARRLVQLRRVAEREILQMAEVVACTCVGAGDPRLAHLRFKYVLIDESTQATEPECLVPLVMGCRQAILVGDHLQLGPVVLAPSARTAGFTRSLFERLVALGTRPVRLQVQYRMHPSLSEFPSNAFYEGSLQNGVAAADRTGAGVVFPWPQPSRPMFFLHTSAPEELAGSGTSYLNRHEADAVARLVSAFIGGGAAPESVGVITPYEGQRAHIAAIMSRSGGLPPEVCRRVEVASVDAFQGREKEFIVLSCVRSNERGDVGFLTDQRRLNVALTRARCGLVVVGNTRLLSQVPLWHSLIAHFAAANAVYEGPLTDLRVATTPLLRPRPTGKPAGSGGGAARAAGAR